ncbi:hypothetical protein ACFL04_04680 [Patescibacteria group bacterium]
MKVIRKKLLITGIALVVISSILFAIGGLKFAIYSKCNWKNVKDVYTSEIVRKCVDYHDGIYWYPTEVSFNKKSFTELGKWTNDVAIYTALIFISLTLIFISFIEFKNNGKVSNRKRSSK